MPRKCPSSNISKKHSFLKLLFPGKTSTEFKQTIKNIGLKAKEFNKNYKNKIEKLSGTELLQAISSYEEIMAESHKIKSYINLRGITVEKNDKWVNATKKRLTNCLHSVKFFESEVAKLPEYELLDKITEENRLSKYNPWLRRIRSYSGKPLAEDEILYIDEQLNQSTNLRNIWAKLSIPQDVELDKELLIITTNENSDIRKKALDKITQDDNTEIESYIQLLYNSYNSRQMLATVMGFNSSEEMWIANSHADTTLLNDLNDSLSPKITNIADKFYKNKAKLQKTPHLAISDLLFSHSPKVNTEKLAEELLEKLTPDNSKDNLNIEILEYCKLPATASTDIPAISFTTENNITICLGSNDGILKDIYEAHAIGTAVQNNIASKNNNFLNEEPLELFSEVAGYFAEYLAFDILANKASSNEERLEIIEFQLERNIQLLAINSTLIQFNQHIAKQLQNTSHIDEKDISKMWLAAVQNNFGSAIDYSDEKISNIWTKFPSIFSNPEKSYKQIIGLSLASKLYEEYQSGDNKDEFIEKFHKFLSSGQTKRPQALLQILDIDINDKNIWQNSLNLLEKLLEKQIRITSKTKNNLSTKPKSNNNGI